MLVPKKTDYSTSKQCFMGLSDKANAFNKLLEDHYITSTCHSP